MTLQMMIQRVRFRKALGDARTGLRYVADYVCDTGNRCQRSRVKLISIFLILIQREAIADGGVTTGLPWDLALGLASQTVTIHSIKICCDTLFAYAV